jgi:lactoylglutathione lyase
MAMPVVPKLSNIRLLVTDFDAALRFYSNVMGFKVPPGHDFPYVEFEMEAGYVAIFDRSFMAAAIDTSGLPSEPAGPSQDRAAIVFEVDNVDEAYAELQSRGAEFATPPTDREDWGIRTAHLRDPDGNLIEIFNRLAAGVTHPAA